MPVSFALAGPVTMTFGPEARPARRRRRPWPARRDREPRQLAGPIAPRLTLAGELWTNFNFDPAGTVKQASADAALAYAVSNNVQLDAGANIGLTRDTPDVELYAGASLRF